MKVCTLGSGSRGNSTYVESGQVRLLIDAGLSGAAMVRRLLDLQVLPVSIAGIFLTHEHADHTRGVRRLAERYKIPVYTNAATAEVIRENLGSSQALKIVPTGDIVTLGGLRIRSFSVPHDSAEPVGYTVESRKRKMAVVTDIGCATTLVIERIRGADLLIVEANHDERRLIDGPYPWAVKERIRGRLGHLSNAEAARMIKKAVANMSDRSAGRRMHVILAHLSENNNDPELARETVARELNGTFADTGSLPVADMSNGGNCKISVAPTRALGPLIDV